MGPRKKPSMPEEEILKIGKLSINKDKYKCNFCTYTTGDKPNYNKHVKTKHRTDKTEYKCDLCDYTSNDKSNFNKHKNSKHKTEKAGYKCDLCDFISQDKSNLNRHVSGMHKECSYCEYITINKKDNISKHIHDNHVKQYYEELAKEENKKKKIETDPYSDVGISKLSMEERRKRYDKWAEQFNNDINTNLPQWICSSCH